MRVICELGDRQGPSNTLRFYDYKLFSRKKLTCQVKFVPIYIETPDLTEVLVGLLTCLKKKKRPGLAGTGVGRLRGKSYLQVGELREECRSSGRSSPSTLASSHQSLMLAVKFMKHSLSELENSFCGLQAPSRGISGDGRVLPAPRTVSF